MTPVKSPTTDISDNTLKNDIQNILIAEQSISNELKELFGEKSFTSTKNNSVNLQSKHKTKQKYFHRIKIFYRNNDLFKYAIWAAGLLFISTLILTIIEWETFYSSVSEHLELSKGLESEPSTTPSLSSSVSPTLQRPSESVSVPSLSKP